MIVFNEDCLKTMSAMGNEIIDLVVTSPPYDGLRTYNGFSFDFESVAKELYRILKHGGVLVWVVNDSTIKGSESLTSFKQAIYFVEKCGFRLHDTMIYQSEKPPLTHNRYEQKFEYMFILSKGKPKTFNPIKEPCAHFGEDKKARTMRQDSDNLGNRAGKGSVGEFKIKGNIWKYSAGYNKSTMDKIAFKHPAIFPEQLAHDHIISWSNEDDWVYDPFTGSGTVAKICSLTNRSFTGSEISKEYCDVIKERTGCVIYEPISITFQ